VSLLNLNVSKTSETPETPETLETLETVSLLNSNVSDTHETREAPGQTPPLDLASITKKSVSSSLAPTHPLFPPTAELTCTGRACPQYISLKDKRGREKTRKLPIWHTTRKQKKKELSDVQITANGRG